MVHMARSLSAWNSCMNLCSALFARFCGHVGCKSRIQGNKFNFLSYGASVGMSVRSSGTSFRAGLSMPTDDCIEQYCVVFACDVLLVCACRVHVVFWSAAVNALSGCC
jgi:hypothetical protein